MQTPDSDQAPLQLLAPDGAFDQELAAGMGVDPDPAFLRELYGWLVLSRHFDQRAVNLQRQGRIGTYPPISGQEACQVGSAAALRKTDWLVPSYRESAAMVMHGVPLERILLYWAGREEGFMFPPDVRCLPITVPIATQLLHAAGLGWGIRLAGEDAVVIAYFGDGATSQGDFHEALNFAGVFRLPLVFFCQNNQYAISVPLARQTASPTLAQKAVAYGFPGVRVDGMDVLAVYAATREAIARAHSGRGPTLIEGLTYRFGPHTTADDPTRYRDPEEAEEWQRQRDPLLRLQRHLTQSGAWSDADEQAAREAAQTQVREAIERFEAFPPPDPAHLFDFVYDDPPPVVAEQREALLAEAGGRPAGEDG